MALKKKVLAVDIDGTLVTPDKRITPRTKAVLSRFQSEGGILVLASGRPPKGMQPYTEALELKKYGGYILAFNGSRVTDAATGQIVAQRFLDNSKLPDILQIAGRYGVFPLTYEGDTALTENAADPYLQLEVSINGLALKVVDNLVEYVDFPIPKCLCTGEPEVLEQLDPALQAALSGVSIFRSESFFLEVNPHGIGKGEVLCDLIRQFNLTADDLVAVGDGYNDITMLQYAGTGIAMGNGREPVKAVADYITASNEEDGLAKAVEEFVLL